MFSQPKKFILSALVTMVFVGPSHAEEIVISPRQPIGIASMDMPPFGIFTRDAVDLSVEQFGGVLLRHEIETKHYGKGCDLRSEIDGFIQGLIREPKTVGLIGPICSGRTLRIVEALSDAQILTISPANTFPGLTDPVFHERIPYYFRTSPNDANQGPLAARFAQAPTEQNGLDADTAVIVTYDFAQPDDFFGIIETGFRNTFDGTILEKFLIQQEQENFTAVLDSIENLGEVDVIYVIIEFPNALPFFEQLRQREALSATAMLGPDAAMHPDIFNLGVSEPMRAYFSNINSIGPNHDAFVQAFHERYGNNRDPGPFDAFAYDATQLMLRAVLAVAEINAEGILRINPENLLDYMNDHANYPYSGAGGVYQTPISGDLRPDAYEIVAAEAGEFKPIFR